MYETNTLQQAIYFSYKKIYISQIMNVTVKQ